MEGPIEGSHVDGTADGIAVVNDGRYDGSIEGANELGTPDGKMVGAMDGAIVG